MKVDLSRRLEDPARNHLEVVPRVNLGRATSDRAALTNDLGSRDSSRVRLSRSRSSPQCRDRRRVVHRDDRRHVVPRPRAYQDRRAGPAAGRGLDEHPRLRVIHPATAVVATPVRLRPRSPQIGGTGRGVPMGEFVYTHACIAFREGAARSHAANRACHPRHHLASTTRHRHVPVGERPAAMTSCLLASVGKSELVTGWRSSYETRLPACAPIPLVVDGDAGAGDAVDASYRGCATPNPRLRAAWRSCRSALATTRTCVTTAAARCTAS